MCKKTAYIAIIAILVFALLIVLVRVSPSVQTTLSNFLFSDGPPREIKSGFSTDLKELLAEQYGLYIPEQAMFLKGCHAAGFRDSYILIAFELDISEEVIHDILLEDEKWSRVSRTVFDATLRFANDSLNSDVAYLKEFRCTAVDNTYLLYKVADSGVVELCFIGWRPSEYFY